MKIYTDINKHFNNTDVGVVLLSDKNDIYLQTAFRISNPEDFEGHIAGIKRALSFVKNVKPLYAKEDVQCIFNSTERNWVDTRLATDTYIKQIKNSLNIKVFTEKPTEEDNYYLMIARQQHSLRKEYLKNSYVY